MPRPLDLRLLWYFKRTAEIGSLTKAAAELRTSQPALTRHIMRLEHDAAFMAAGAAQRTSTDGVFIPSRARGECLPDADPACCPLAGSGSL